MKHLGSDRNISAGTTTHIVEMDQGEWAAIYELTSGTMALKASAVYEWKNAKKEIAAAARALGLSVGDVPA